MERPIALRTGLLRALWGMCLALLVAVATGPGAGSLSGPEAHRLLVVPIEAVLSHAALGRDLGVFPHLKSDGAGDGKAAGLLPRAGLDLRRPAGRIARPSGDSAPVFVARPSGFAARAPPIG